MSYTQGDFLAIQTKEGRYISVLVIMIDESGYHLVFTDYEGEQLPSGAYFDDCPLLVIQFGMGEAQYTAFDTVIISKERLDHASEVYFILHYNMPGMIATMGLMPMSDIEAISRHFTDFRKEQKAKDEESEQASPFQKTWMSKQDIFKKAALVNPFPTVKLYRNENGNIKYWQIYGVAAPISLIVSHGQLGMTGQYQEIKDQSQEEVEKIYHGLIAEKRREGFEEPEKMDSLILQFKTDDSWGGAEDLDFRNEQWNYLDRYLFWTGNGAITGGDIGSGSINLFFEAISPEMAISTITAALKEKQMRRKFLIAIEEKAVTGAKTNGLRVLYPENHDEPFSY